MSKSKDIAACPWCKGTDIERVEDEFEGDPFVFCTNSACIGYGQMLTPEQWNALTPEWQDQPDKPGRWWRRQPWGTYYVLLYVNQDNVLCTVTDATPVSDLAPSQWSPAHVPAPPEVNDD